MATFQHQPSAFTALPTEVVHRITDYLRAYAIPPLRLVNRELKHKIEAVFVKIFISKAYVRAGGLESSLERLDWLTQDGQYGPFVKSLNIRMDVERRPDVELDDIMDIIGSILPRLTNLEELTVSNFFNRLWDLKSCLHFPALTTLTVCRANGSIDDYVDVLTSHPALKTVKFYFCRVQFSCWNAVLEAAISLPELRHFYLWNADEKWKGRTAPMAIFHALDDDQNPKPDHLRYEQQDPVAVPGISYTSTKHRRSEYEIIAQEADQMRECLSWMMDNHALQNHLGELEEHPEF